MLYRQRPRSFGGSISVVTDTNDIGFTLREHLSCLFKKDGWYFNLFYIITFGVSSAFLP